MKLSTIRNVERMRAIAETAARHGFGYFFERHNLRRHLPRRMAGPGHQASRGEHIRLMLEELGPTFVKFGQLLSTRPDVVPSDILLEMRKLQDDVTGFPVEIAHEMIERELGLSVERLFLEFDDEPIAAASIGQVHRAVLPNGDRVIVKVQRPEAEAQIYADIELLYQLSQTLAEYWQDIFIDPVALVDQFARGIRSELDYKGEAHNAERFQKNFAGDDSVHIPQVYWQYTTARVLTLEEMPGVQLSDLDFDAMDMFDRKALAGVIAAAWLKQIYVHGFFHGDPHPANILVENDGTISLIDFGIAGRLSDSDRTNIIRLFLDVMNEKIERIPRRMEALGVDFPREREAEFVAELRDIFTKYYGATLDDLDPVAVFRDIFGAIYRLRIKLPTHFLLLEKSAATLEGIGSQLYPDFNIFDFALPYSRDLVQRQMRPDVLAAQGLSELNNYFTMFREFPGQVAEALELVRRGDLKVNFVHSNLETLGHRLTVLTNRLVLAIIYAAIILGSSIIGLSTEGGPRLLGVSIFAMFGFLASGFLALWLAVGIIRSGRH
ncbi:MAG: ABC1 kinase family protein [Thermoleophilia bacterium]